MYSLEPRLPGAEPPRAVLLDAALRQAERDAEDVPGGYARAPWNFRPAPEAVDARLDAMAGRDRTWILVTCRLGDATAHTQERCFTAVQRYLLSLAAEGVDAVWIGADALPADLDEIVSVASGEDLVGVVHFDPA